MFDLQISLELLYGYIYTTPFVRLRTFLCILVVHLNNSGVLCT